MTKAKASSRLSKFRRKVLGGWEPREKIFRPVIINLVTGLLIFVVAWFANDLFYKYIARQTTVPAWPIYCVVEPLVDREGGPVHAELFVINTSTERYTLADLDKLAKDSSGKYGAPVSSAIQVAMKDYLLDGKLSVQEDTEFNREKGKPRIRQIDSAHSEVLIEDIKPGAMLKFLISTDEERPITARADFETLPVKVSYARKP
jgi:hypothetical protein